jgi:cell division septation protein DedD
LNTRYETDRDLQDLLEPAGQDREISLGTTTILGIFFALALLCAVFFGFGYSLGRRSALPLANPAETTGSESNTPKPAPGSSANQLAPAKQSAGTAQSAIVDSSNDAGEDSPQSSTPDLVKVVATPASPDVHVDPKTARKLPAVAPVPISSPGSSVVQVAAMSHQEDANVVAVDLKRRGYTVAIRHESQDKLFHVQIGPFANKKDADAMRQHLQTDGYNSAIVK